MRRLLIIRLAENARSKKARATGNKDEDSDSGERRGRTGSKLHFFSLQKSFYVNWHITSGTKVRKPDFSNYHGIFRTNVR